VPYLALKLSNYVVILAVVEVVKQVVRLPVVLFPYLVLMSEMSAVFRDPR
jgi:hypothetical protein